MPEPVNPNYDIAAALSGAYDNLANFAVSPQFPILAGQLAGATMVPDKGPRIAAFGNVASNWGKSALAAKAAQEQSKKQEDMWTKLLPMLLSGQGLTEKGIAGPTSVSIKPGGEVTISGNLSNSGENAPAGEQAQPQQAQPQVVPQTGMAPVAPAAPVMPDLMRNRNLPF